MTDWPKISAADHKGVAWMEIIEREVEFAPGAKPELYHAVAQQDYTAIVARTPDGQIPIVRQYRPALERFTWELPAGLVTRARRPRFAAGANCWRRPAFPRVTCIRWQLCGVYGTAIEPNTFVLCRDRAALRPAGDRARHRAQAGGAQGTCCTDSGRRVRAAIAYWRPATRRHARPSRPGNAVTMCALREL